MDKTLKRLFDLAPQPMWLYAAEGLRYIAVNDAACERFGYSPAEFLQITRHELLLNGESDFDGNLDDAASTPQIRHYRTKTGDVKTVRSLVEATVTGDGRHAYFETVLEDITQREETEERMSQILNTVRCLLFEADVIDLGDVLGWHTHIHNLEGARQFLPVAIPDGMTYVEAFHLAKLPEDCERMLQLSEPAIRQGKSGYQQEYRVRLADGSIRWLFEDVSIKPTFDGHWKLTGVCTDNTEQKQVHEELARVLESARCLLWQADVIDIGGGVLDWHLEFRNPDAAQLYLPLAIPPGGTYLDGFGAAKLPEEQPAMKMATPAELRAANGGYQQEFRIRTATGDMRWLLEDVTIEQLEGDRWRLTGVCTDITERKRAQEEVSQLLTSAHCLLWQAEVVDTGSGLQWDLSFRNPDAAQKFLPVDIPEGGTYTEGFFNARPVEHWETVNSRSETALRHGEKRYQQEFSVRSSNGELRWMYEDVHVEVREAGRWWLTGVCTDVTERKEAEQAISQVLTSARCMLWQSIVNEVDGTLNWSTQVRSLESVLQFLPIELPDGMSYAEAFHAAKLPEDAERMAPITRNAILTRQERLQHVFRIRLIGGEVRWVYEDVSIEPLAEGQWKLTGVCTDITERKLAEDSMSHVQATARCLLWHANVEDLDGFLNWSIDILNPEAAQQLLAMDVRPGDTYSHAFYLAKLPDDLPRLDATSTAALRSGQNSYHQEYRIRVADGDIRWLEESVNIEVEREGLWRLTGVCLDVTQRKRAEEEVSLILKSARCLLWQADVFERDGAFEWSEDRYNTGGRDEFGAQTFTGGLKKDGSTVKNFSGRRVDEDDERMAMVSQQALLAGDTGYRQEYRVKSDNGEIHWIAEDVSIEPRAPGEWRLTGVCTDVTDRKRVELALSESEMRLRAVIESIDEIAFEFDPDGTYLQVWTANDQLLVRPRSELIGRRVADVLGEETTRPFVDAFKRVTKELQPMSMEYSIDLPNGTHWFLARISPILTAEGTCKSVCMLARDITERKHSEDALRASEARHQRITANVPGTVSQLLVHTDGSYRISFMNVGSRAMFGRDPEEYEQDPSLLLETIHPDEREAFLASLAGASKTLAPWHWEGRCFTASGELKWIQAISRPELQPNGDILWDCLLLDVTLRKQAERMMEEIQADLASRVHDRTRDLRHTNVALQAEIAERVQAQEELKASEARYRAIVQDQSEMICRFSADGTLSFVNEAHCRYFEANPEELLGTSFLRFLSTGDEKRIRQHLESLSPSNPLGSYEIKSLTRGGDVRWQQWTDRYISNESGEFVCFQSVGRDITEQKLAEEAMFLAKEEAERANLAKSEFLSRMSHELRTPLNAILGFGQILERQNLSPLAKESIQHILKGGRHLLSLINEVLDLAKVEAGRIETSIEPVSLVETVTASCDLVSSLRQEHGVSVVVDLAHLEPYHVLADQQRLKQVLINLLSNGIKYNRPDGQVSVTWKEVAEGRIRIEVRDTGPGISTEDLPKLFVPFERLGATHSSIEGTGLGLALSQRLITAMGGTITVRSVIGEGSTFAIELPRATDPVSAIEFVARPMGDDGEVSGCRYSILCIEDNLSNLRLLEVILGGRPEITLHSALQGSIGLELARELKPDLILLDINLPDMKGNRVLDVLRSSEVTGEIPVLVISADATAGQIDRLMLAGAVGYLTKPLDVGEFLDAIDKVLH